MNEAKDSREAPENAPTSEPVEDVKTVRKATSRASKETPEEKADRLAAKREHYAQVLSRGLVNHRLEVPDADPNKRYVWVRDRPEDIDKYRTLDYGIESDQGSGMHGSGDTRRTVGDVVLMSTSLENHQLIEDIRAQEKARRMGQGKRDYADHAKSGAVPIFGDFTEPEKVTRGIPERVTRGG